MFLDRDRIRGLLPARLRGLIRSWRRSRVGDRRTFADVFEEESVARDRGKLVLGVGGGRCGMRWFSRVMDAHENCVGTAERFGEFEAFYRFVTFHQLPVDMRGFVELLRRAVNHDWQTAEVSAMFSPFLAFGLGPLVEQLAPNEIVLHLRRPEAVVNSLFVKGWYSGEYVRESETSCPGPQPLHCRTLYHGFSRIAPSGAQWDEWSQLTRIGKISWYYVTIHDALVRQFRAVEGPRKWIVKLEDIDQDYEFYRMFSESVDVGPTLPRRKFLGLKASTPNVGSQPRRRVEEWSGREKAEFESIVGPFRDTYDSLVTTWR